MKKEGNYYLFVRAPFIIRSRESEDRESEDRARHWKSSQTSSQG